MWVKNTTDKKLRQDLEVSENANRFLLGEMMNKN
jgi:hypothetical protein